MAIRLERFRGLLDTASRGRLAEREARRWLVRNGFRILRSNVASRSGEVDLVAVEAGVLCFVEIKARSGPSFGTAAAAVTLTKRRKLVREAERWLRRHPWEGPCRFDVLALDRVLEGGSAVWRIHLIRGAFELDERH
ncbi:MAG: YraN family protein [Acidobacteriota bacterium]